MKQMTSRERVLATLNKQTVDRIPYCELAVDMNVAFQAAIMDGAVTPDEVQNIFTEAMKTANIDPNGTSSMREGLKIYNKIEPYVSKFLKRDNITYLGTLTIFNDSLMYLQNPEQAHLGFSADGIIKTKDDLKNIKFSDIGILVEDAKEFLKNKGDFAACLEMFMGVDPAIHSMGFEDFCCWLIEDPKFIKEYMDKICSYLSELMQEMCKLDFDFIWVADDMAYNVSPFFSPKAYKELILPYTRKVAEKITKPWIFHSDGNLLPIWDDLLSQGMDAIHPLEPGSMDLEYLRDNYNDKVGFVGGVALTILESGTSEESKQDTKRILDIFKGKAHYMLSTCNTVTPNVKPENLKVMLDTLKCHGEF